MIDYNVAIANLGTQIITGKTPLIRMLPTRAGLCLTFVRIVIETATGVKPYTLYARYVKSGTTAANAEHDLAPWRIPLNQRRPGDIIFSPNHIAILLDHDLVLENTTANRGTVILGAIRLTPLARWDKVTSIVRIPLNFGG